MKLKNVKVGETYVIKSLDHTIVGDSLFNIGDIVEVVGLTEYPVNTIKVSCGYGISHKDLKQAPIEYPCPMMEHLGKEVEVVEDDYYIKLGMRGFVVSFSKEENRLLIDFGVDFYGHNGRTSGHPQKTETCWFVDVDNLKFLTEEDE